MTAWAGTSPLLAAPWAFASTWPHALAALILTALPPIGLIGWESPLNATGALLPVRDAEVGVIVTLVAIALLADFPQRPRLLMLGIVALTLNFNYRPRRWHRPAGSASTPIFRPLVGRSAGRSQTGKPSSLQGPMVSALASRCWVLVFGEGLFDDWYPATRQSISAGMNSLHVPPHTAWLIGTSADGYDALVAVRPGNARSGPGHARRSCADWRRVAPVAEQRQHSRTATSVVAARLQARRAAGMGIDLRRTVAFVDVA